MTTEERTGPLWRALTRVAASRPVAWFYVNVAPRIDRPLSRLTSGRIGLAGSRGGVLRVRGARTGVERLTPLLVTRDGENVVVVASRGGDRRHPAWYRNVVANPDVSLSIRGVERPYRAREAEGSERQRLWEAVNRTYGGYERYQERAGERLIPVIVLEPR